jgi:hypothetical protein
MNFISTLNKLSNASTIIHHIRKTNIIVDSAVNKLLKLAINIQESSRSQSELCHQLLIINKIQSKVCEVQTNDNKSHTIILLTKDKSTDVYEYQDFIKNYNTKIHSLIQELPG